MSLLKLGKVMKKISIFLLVILIGLAVLPIIGNKLIKETLDSKVELLQSNGIELRDSSVESGYLNSSRHYEFMISDTNKFLKYLSKYSDKQLPAYTTALLNGTVIATDFKYSNIPFSEAVKVDIYPLTLSDELIKGLKESDDSFAQYVKKFIAQKGILYHINYNIVSQNFDGFIKDIDEEHTMNNGAKLFIKIKKAIFNGNGSLIAPATLQVSSDTIALKILNTVEEISIEFNKLNTASTFNSQTTYLTSAKLESLIIHLNDDKGDKGSIKIVDSFVNVSLNTQGSKAEFNSKSSFSKIFIESNKLHLKASSFNYDIAVFGVDKDALEELRVLLSKAKVLGSIDLATNVVNSSIRLLSKGLNLTIADLSMNNINLDGNDLDGFKIKTELIVKEDKKLAKNIKYSPMYIAKNIDFDFNLKVSKKIFIKILSMQPMMVLAQSYAKDAGDDLIFDVTLKNNKLKVNDKVLGK